MKKLLILALSCLTCVSMMAGCGGNTDKPAEGGETAATAKKVGVFLYKFDDTYISTVRQNLEKIGSENADKVAFEFFDGKGDQSVQNDAIDTLLSKGCDLLMVNLVDTEAAQMVVDKIKAKDVPVVFFNREPGDSSIIKSYEKAIFVGTNAKDAGIIQGQMITDLWNSDKKYDKNGDGVMQYVMLQGEATNPEAIARTEYSVSTVEDAGIKTEKLEFQICDWDQDKAQQAVEAWWSKHKDGIEVIIANNDGMAQGAIAALNAQGYNTGDAEKYVPVYGVDATAAAQDLINQDKMSGTVLQDAEGMAKALYATGMNLAEGKSAIEGTDYTFDKTEISVRIPYQEYKK